MSEVTHILSQIEEGDPQAAEKLLPLVYDELRKLAAVRLAQEQPGQTLVATALVHEAYLRLVGGAKGARDSGFGTQGHDLEAPPSGPSPETRIPSFDSRGHFFAAAAEAMRRILVEAARRKQSQKQGGGLMRCDVDLDAVALDDTQQPLVVLSVHEALDRLAEKSPRKAELVKLRYFLGYTVAEAADVLGIAAATAEEDWTYARTWLRREWLRSQAEPDA